MSGVLGDRADYAKDVYLKFFNGVELTFKIFDFHSKFLVFPLFVDDAFTEVGRFLHRLDFLLTHPLHKQRLDPVSEPISRGTCERSDLPESTC